MTGKLSKTSVEPNGFRRVGHNLVEYGSEESGEHVACLPLPSVKVSGGSSRNRPLTVLRREGLRCHSKALVLFVGRDERN
jgi:hypothetical protein